MEKLTFDYSKATDFISEEEISYMSKIAEQAKETLVSKSGAGNDFLGWVDLPVDYDKEEFVRIETAAKKIQKDSEVFIVIGIGGSYLGARAAIECLRHGFYNNLPKEKRGTPEIYFVGSNISSTYLQGVIDVVGDRDFSVNVISKSGTTTEPAIAFRIFKKMLEEKYGKEEAARRIYATTDKKRGALKDLATKEGYESFVVPDDVGGRFSVCTAVGLLPIAVSGADIKALMEGAAKGREIALNEKFENNAAVQYAAIRNILLRKGKSVEVLVNYEPALHYVNEWWKQLYGESEGKDQKGIFPAAVDFTTDLHSMGQFIQDGARIMYETVMCVGESRADITIEEEPVDLDGLNYLSGKTMDFVNKNAMNGTILAHTDGNVPNLMIHIPKMDEYSLGQLFYFFEFACG
ncbi:MAG: glucose-6-phosphate isomerase, partial [Lachnospiraceae bacterium]|nr:glucose-6-phosphate isomerase [Lachnospiraceae bacterium]